MKCRVTEECKWVNRITNENVLDRIKEKRTLWKNLNKRRAQDARLRNGGSLRDILESGVKKTTTENLIIHKINHSHRNFNKIINIS